MWMRQFITALNRIEVISWLISLDEKAEMTQIINILHFDELTDHIT